MAKANELQPLVSLQLEGIIPALETSHAIAYLESPQLTGSPRIIICCSGRGDKDVHTVAQFLNAT